MLRHSLYACLMVEELERDSFGVEGRQRDCSFRRESNQAVNSCGCGCGRGSNESICGESLCEINSTLGHIGFLST